MSDAAAAGPEASALPVVVMVDVANVMGSRPDGWWRDRAGAATRLLERMPQLAGRTVDAPEPAPPVSVLTISRVVAVLEGAAKAASVPEGIDIVLAPADGDGTIVAEASRLIATGEHVVVVTADRGLRARLDPGAHVAGPGWFNELIGR